MDKRDLRDPEKLGELLLLAARNVRVGNFANRGLSVVYEWRLDQGIGWTVPDVVDVGPLDRYPRS